MHANGKSRLIAAAGAAYLGMGYLAAISDHPPLIAILLGIVPLGAVPLHVEGYPLKLDALLS